MKFVAFAVITYLALCVYVFLIQKKLLFFPDETAFTDCPPLIKLGGMVYESQDHKTRLYHLSSTSTAPKGWVLLFHGNGGRACDRMATAHQFLERGYHVILTEYPGYAEIAPLPSTKEILEIAKKSYDYLVSKNESKLPIFLFGESLGTGPATYLAAQNLQYLTGLILQTPFTSLGDIGQHHYAFLPVKFLITQDFPAFRWAPDVKIPVFIFHGNQDEVIPLELGKKQSQFFSKELVSFLEVEGAHHNDLMYFNESLIWNKIDEFLLPLESRGH
jgi:uncharacterized protein